MNERKGFLILLLFATGILLISMLQPFFTYIIAAMILAFVLRKPHRRLRDVTGERVSALLLTVASVLLAIVPVVVGGAAVADDAKDVVQEVRDGTAFDFTQVENLISTFLDSSIDLEKTAANMIREFSSAILGNFTDIVTALAGVLIGISLMLFLEYYFLKDGEDLVDWLIDFSPLPEQMERNLLRELSQTTSAVLKGHIFVAIAQGLIAGLGLLIFGVPNPIFWTFIMIVLGVIPVIGSSLVWVPAGFYLLIENQPFAGIMLLLYGLVIVSLSDNFLRPYFVDRSADLNPALIILGVLGGVTFLGPVGLFIGPIIFGIFKSVAKVFIENYEEL